MVRVSDFAYVQPSLPYMQVDYQRLMRRKVESRLPEQARFTSASLPQYQLSTTDTIQRRRIDALRIFQETVPFTTLLRPSQVKRHSVACSVRTLKVVETRAGFHAILESVDKDTEDVVIVESGVA